MSTLIPRIRLKNAGAWARHGRARWPVSIAAFLVALLARMALHPLLDDELPLLFFSIATLVVQFYFGLAPALLVAALSLPAGDYFFVPPYNTFAWPEQEDVLDIAYYIVSTGCFMVLIQYLRRALYQSVLLAEIAESRYRMLLDAEAEREALETEIQTRAG